MGGLISEGGRMEGKGNNCLRKAMDMQGREAEGELLWIGESYTIQELVTYS